MAFRVLFSIITLGLGTFLLAGCSATQVRLPSSVAQVYKNSEIQQLLAMTAQNSILFNIPDATTREFEKTEIDAKCREVDEPLWAEKLSVYLSEFRKRPELLTRFHILEIKRGDSSQIQVQKDLDGAVTISIQFVKIESRGKVQLETKLPCKASIAEYLGRELIKTDFDFPSVAKFDAVLQKLPERAPVSRLQFANGFLSYLAERGVIFKFNHEMSFEKTTNGQYVMAEAMNQLSAETRQPFHKHLNYWFKQISEKSVQASIIQMFGIIPEKVLKTGVKVESEGSNKSRMMGETDLTYVYIGYSVENDAVKLASLKDLDQCLQTLTTEMTGVKLRKPASTEPESFLRPGYSCSVSNTPESIK